MTQFYNYRGGIALAHDEIDEALAFWNHHRNDPKLYDLPEQYDDDPIDPTPYGKTHMPDVAGSYAERYGVWYYREWISWCPLVRRGSVLMIDGELSIITASSFLTASAIKRGGVTEINFVHSPAIDFRTVSLDDLSDRDRDWVIMETLGLT